MMYPTDVTPTEAREIRQRFGESDHVARHPHCNPEVLHAPGICVFCDLYPERQKTRAAGNTPFTPAASNGWGGNVAVPVRGGED